jgi:acyl dehydratase
MKLPATLVGASAGPHVHTIDARWLMAYAAALGDTAPEYLDTTRPGGIIGHPLFPVCYEWPVALDLRARMPEAVALQSVHASHDLRIHRRPRPGDRLSTRATVLSMEARPPGAYVVTRFETVDVDGQPVSTTDYGSIYRGVECASDDASPRSARSPEARERRDSREGAPDWTTDVPIAATLSHVYTECARIWNPIHTDRAVARAAGLPEIILHGTANLALAVSAAISRHSDGAAVEISRIAGRFRGMVRLPSVLRVEGWDRSKSAPRVLAFRALAEDGRPAVDEGYLEIASDA